MFSQAVLLSHVRLFSSSYTYWLMDSTLFHPCLFITYWLIWISQLRMNTHRLFWRHAWHLRFICILRYSMTRYFGNACLIIILHLSERTRICLYSQPRIIICCYLLAVGTFITRFSARATHVSDVQQGTLAGTGTQWLSATSRRSSSPRLALSPWEGKTSHTC